ncbi:methyltransferase domain-containing protein [Glaciihabitans arcticus]|uniref:methyltransferase domain-containing protein n=1 Tax=Glaciihabitans arcticus TaxID=2668039 RepID=UPI0013867C0D|nr:methyltransferase domain-containing protein [Glaciihabitans arcticus]
MSSAILAGWLRCPRCGQDLEQHNNLDLACSEGHHYDANRRGYLNTLDGSRGIHGDTRGILLAREAFLARGHYQPIADALSSALPSRRDLQILDSGCGTGYYLKRGLAARPGAEGLALDASAAAVTIAVAATGAAGLVADVWRELGIRSSRADVVLCVFAPRNASEFARVLRPDGSLIVVTPQPEHLAELRAEGRLLGMQDDKLGQLDATLGELFELESRESLDYRVDLSPAEADLVAAMGPSGHHELAETAVDHRDVTVAVDVSVFVKL